MSNLRHTLLLSLLALSAVPSTAGTVGWYNGDFDGVNGLSNEINTDVSDSRVYENFLVPVGGWTVTGLFSNNFMNFTGVTQALWEIRSGVSIGNGGTLLYSGTDAATQIATGRSGFGMTEYTIEVSGLNLFLAPGTYWMTVAPVGSGSGRSYLATTSGANAVGSPTVDENSFFDSIHFAENFGDPSTQIGGPGNFSSGVIIDSATVPEPGTLGMLLGGGLLVAAMRRRRG